MGRTRVKICGLTSRQDAELAIELGADALGCICIKHSKRYRDPLQISCIFNNLPPFVTRVAVVADPPPELLVRLVGCGVDYIQFHGEETPSLLQQCPLPWYKAVSGHAGYNHGVEAYASSPVLLVDAPSGGGGKGKEWDWQKLPPWQDRNRPLILAGGLTPGNVAAAITSVRPWAVDVASGVESAPGVKDRTQMAEFIEIVGQTTF